MMAIFDEKKEFSFPNLLVSHPDFILALGFVVSAAILTSSCQEQNIVVECRSGLSALLFLRVVVLAAAVEQFAL